MDNHIDILVKDIFPKLSDMMLSMRTSYAYGKSTDAESISDIEKVFLLESELIEKAIVNYIAQLRDTYSNLNIYTLNTMYAYEYNKCHKECKKIIG